MTRELRKEISGAGDLPLHLLDLEIRGDAGLRCQRCGDEQGEQRAASGERNHSAKYPLRAFTISMSLCRGVMLIDRQPLTFPWLW